MKNAKVIAAIAALTVAVSSVTGQETDLVVQRSAIDPATGLPAGVENTKRQIESQKSELDKAAKALSDSKSATKLAQAKAGEQRVFAQRLAGVVHRSGSSRALVIPKDSDDTKSIMEVEEDLNVMAHILDKAGNDDKAQRAMGIAVFNPLMSSASQNLYIEGHGAIFFLNVNYPLLPPAAKEGDAEAKEKPDSEWDEARREIAGSGHRGSENPFVDFEERYGTVGPLTDKSRMEYDADRVEDLKKDLISALKNTVHIRKLKGDETVTVVVTGAGSGGPPRPPKPARPASGGGGGSGGTSGSGEYRERVTAKVGGDRASANSGGKLILKTRKSDCEAFQNGNLNADEFRKKVTVMLY